MNRASSVTTSASSQVWTSGCFFLCLLVIAALASCTSPTQLGDGDKGQQPSASSGRVDTEVVVAGSYTGDPDLDYRSTRVERTSANTAGHTIAVHPTPGAAVFVFAPAYAGAADASYSPEQIAAISEAVGPLLGHSVTPDSQPVRKEENGPTSAPVGR